MSYVVLARKWRPQRFEDLVGQEHVARTLANAITAGRVAHAFLFTGVRGVGKTSSARILAKALNCMGKPGTVSSGVDSGPTVSPCLECPACLEIAAGTDVDVWEIDGASYNGVDEVRRLQESIPYRPSRDRYKIYIVDEVHMLSQAAWNAFLKTLEEPPAHVKFIFATTEVHKVPVTILSRVQRFDFKLIPARLIVERLKQLLCAEGISAEPAALSIIARQAAGSMRDAISLLDQVIAWGGSELRAEGVCRVLGVASREVLEQMARSLVQGDAERCLSIVAQLVNQSYDMGHVARDLLELLRDLVVARVCSNPGACLELPEEEKRTVIDLAGRAELDDLLRLHQGFSQGYDDVLRSGQPRAALEMLLVRLCRRPPLWPIDDLLARLSALEKRLGGDGSRPDGTPSPGGPAAGAVGPGTRARSAGSRRAASAEVAEPLGKQSGARGGPGPGLAPPSDWTDLRGHQTADSSRLSPVHSAAASSGTGGWPQTRARRSLQPVEPERASGSPRPDPELQPKQGGSTRQAVPTHPEPSPAGFKTEVLAGLAAEDAVCTTWRDLVEQVALRRPDLAGLLAHAVPLRVDRTEIRLAWAPGSPLCDRSIEAACREELLNAACERIGAQVRVSIEPWNGPLQGQMASLAQLEAQARQEEQDRLLARVRAHPRVSDAIEILGARLKEVRRRPD